MAKYSVYRNLNKPGMFSIKQSGIVLDWAPTILLEKKIAFHVGESGRLRVIRDRRKNVHSWIKSEMFTVLKETPSLEKYVELWYDPYYAQHYYCTRTGKKVISAHKVVMANNRAYTLQPTYQLE